MLLCALTALMVTAANAAENPDSTNYMLPGCKLLKKEGLRGFVWVNLGLQA
jgi:hypothetical protein